MFIKLITRLLLVVLALLLAAYTVPGVEVASLYVAVIVAVLLGLLNLFVRPILILLTLPLTILTLGVFVFILNALLLWFTASFVEGFSVEGFSPALWGTLIISFFSWVGNRFL